MDNKQQTAVEWLWEIAYNRELTVEDWKQAKEMEKEQMLECYLKADVFPRKYEFEKWYNETYGDDKQ
jgi:hypothetical protein